MHVINLLLTFVLLICLLSGGVRVSLGAGLSQEHSRVEGNYFASPTLPKNERKAFNRCSRDIKYYQSS